MSRKVSADDLDMDSFLQTFEQQLIAQERASDSVSQAPRRVHNQGHAHTTAFVANAPGPPVCVSRQQSHFPTDCSSVPDLIARKRILRNSGRCFNCFRKNHFSRNCLSTSKCKCCQGKHHTSICERGSYSRENPSLAMPLKSILKRLHTLRIQLLIHSVQLKRRPYYCRPLTRLSTTHRSQNSPLKSTSCLTAGVSDLI